MRTEPVIYVPVISQFVEEGRARMQDIYEAEGRVGKIEKLLGEAREATQMRRFEMGALLVKVRATLPRRGTKEDGWLAYLGAIELDDSTAHRYMELVKNPAPERDADATSHVRSSDAGQPAAPPPKDEDIPASEPPADEPKADRDQWCTPLWIAQAIGHWDLDPCSNARSHIESRLAYRLPDQDGLLMAPTHAHHARVFVNPPYSDVMPWVEAYKHTRFCFLVKFDPSTKWCELLLEHTSLILFPKRTRIEFEPPPEEQWAAGGNQFPHGLFFAHAEDATDDIRNACFHFNKA